MIKDIRVWTVFTNTGQVTLAAKVLTERGCGIASVPLGISVGQNEAKILPPKEVEIAFKKIKRMLLRKDEDDVDRTLFKIDPTPNFSKIGGNLALAVSLAAARAKHNNLWEIGNPKAFPLPVVNIIGGGAHGGGTDWQEFLIIPVKAKNPLEATQTAIEVWQIAGHGLQENGLLKGKNSEGAWTTRLDDIKTLEFLSDIASDWGCKIGIDCAASRLWDGYGYSYTALWKVLRPDQQIDFIAEICQKYKIIYIEDPFHQNDFSAFSTFMSSVKNTLVIGDDLYCTRSDRLSLGIKEKATNGIIIKPNQVGTLSFAKDTVELAKKAKMTIVPSHRSQETEDNWIVDLALAWEAPLIKIGMADMPKFNRLIELWGVLPQKMAQFKI